MLWLLKLTLAPMLVAGASLAGRRWGPRIAGWIVGFPIVAGPTLFFYAVEQGPVFASEAAYKTIIGLYPYCLFALVFAALSERLNRWLSLGLGWATFFLGTVVFQAFYAVSLWPTLVLVSCALGLTWYLLPKPAHAWVPAAHGKWDLWVRMLSAAALVITLTELADVLGPSWSGILTPFPVASSVLTMAAHINHGFKGAMPVLAGVIVGLISFACFCAVLSVLLVPLGIFPAFLAALVVGAVAQVLILRCWPK